MMRMLKARWDELGQDEPIERGPGLVIAAAGLYPVIWLVIGGGALIGWW